jgi:hypothetical protein
MAASNKQQKYQGAQQAQGAFKATEDRMMYGSNKRDKQHQEHAHGFHALKDWTINNNA